MSDKQKWTISDLLRNPTASKVISVLIAIAVWFFVVYVVDPVGTNTIDGVPVSFDETVLQSLQMSVIEGDDVTMSVEVTGKRVDIGNLTSGDIQLVARMTAVKGAGQYELQVEAVNPSNGLYTVQIKGNRTILVTFDRMMSKEIPVELDIYGLSVPDVYMLGTVEVTPTVITIHGPQREVTKVDKALVVYEGNNTSLTESQIQDVPFQLLDQQGNPVDMGHIDLSQDTVSLVIPIGQIVDLPLVVSFTNVPRGLDSSTLDYHLSSETVRVAAPEDALRNVREILVGNINFETLDLSQQTVYTFPVTLPNGFTNINYTQEVVVEFAGNYDTTTLSLNNFVFTNVPDGYEANLVTVALNSVKIVGTVGDLADIHASDFVVEVDLADREIRLAPQEIPVKIYAPDSGQVWALGSYSVVVEVRALETDG